MSLPGLRSFSAVSWESGQVDATAWLRLTRFGVSEQPRGGSGVESALAHPVVEVLALRRYAGPDLSTTTTLATRVFGLKDDGVAAVRAALDVPAGSTADRGSATTSGATASSPWRRPARLRLRSTRPQPLGPRLAIRLNGQSSAKAERR